MRDHDLPHVLIVDDDPRNLDVVELMLEKVDCTLVRAASADEALLSVVAHDFAALVLDIKMPGMDGLELARLIKQRKKSRHVPILFLTAYAVDERDLLQGYGVGAVDYLTKPINAEILRSKVNAFVEAFRNSRSLVRLNDALQSEAAERRTAQEALQRAHDELDERVRERTEALNRAHRTVRENEERLRMALEVARIAAWEWHLPSGQMHWSTEPEALFGFPSGAFGPMQRLATVAHPADRQRLEGAIEDSLTGGTYEAEYRALRPDGSVMWVTERGQVFADGDQARMVGISRDVTAERELAQERERLLKRERAARDEAERQGQLKDEFLATLSHELRTPMNAILGWLELLQSGKLVRDVPMALEVITRNARIQSRLIEDLIDMNRLMAGSVSLELAEVAVGGLLSATVKTLQPLADEKSIQLTSQVDARAEVALADPERLQQVMWNLLQNAIKFTPTGGRVEVTVNREGDDVVMDVTDNGRGIAASFLPHVFDRFRQQDGSSTRGTSGLGLGLAIAKQLVDLHGGTIRATSAGEGLGATFVVSIPAPLQSSSRERIGPTPAAVVSGPDARGGART